MNVRTWIRDKRHGAARRSETERMDLLMRRVDELTAENARLHGAAADGETALSRLAESEARLRRLFESSPVPLALVDPERLRFLDANARACEALGYARDELIGLPLTAIEAQMDQDELAAQARAANVDGAPLEFETRHRRRSGEVRDVLVRAERPIVDGRMVVQVAWVDITARKAAERGLAESQALLNAVLDALPVGVLIADRQGRLVRDNAAHRRIWGLAPQTDSWEQYADWVGYWPDSGRRIAADEGAMARALLKGETVTNELVECQPFDGGPRRFYLNNAAPVRDGRGAVVGGVVVELDVTEWRRAERQRELLAREMNHRVKNTLATIQSLAAQTLRHGCDEPARASFEQRLMSLAEAHDLLTRENWAGARLRDVACAALKPYMHGAAEYEPDAETDRGRDDAAALKRVALDGPDVHLTPETALALGMAFHELATNAAKYGALSVETGRVALRWTVAGDRLRIDWRERGGPPVAAPARRGFGSRLIEGGLAHELRGEASLTFEPTGLACRIDMPVPREGDA